MALAGCLVLPQCEELGVTIGWGGETADSAETPCRIRHTNCTAFRETPEEI